MHSLDVDADVRRVLPGGADESNLLARRECAPPSPVVDVHKVRCRRGYLPPVEVGVASGDDRPRVHVGGCLPGEVPGVELGECGVDVVGIENMV